MSSNSFTSSLPFKLIVALVVGILAGLGLTSIEGSTLCNALLNIIVTVRYISGQFINFCVPLIIIGFVAPSITRLGSNASKMLILALILAYVSSIGAAFSATAAGYSILPFMNIVSEVEGLKALPSVVFALAIPQIMPVMSALFLSITVGLAAAWNKSETVIKLLEEFQKIVLSIVTKFLIPVLPFLIGTTFCGLAYEGSLTKQLPVFLMIILIVMAGHYIWLALLYFIAGVYSGKNPFNIIKNYGPAYMTAVGTMSSAATLSVALECARKSEPTLRDDMVNFGIPLFANIHLCGSVMTETFFVMAVSKILYGVYPSVGNMILFCILLGIFAIGAPGVPGGTVMASLGLITGVLGFDATGTALMLTIFALQDSFGTACNVTGDGALTLMLTGYAEKHNIA
ncbi:MAG: dicarboxylate/amino acid:cation symporter [Synergistaceae bacterium]|nr:dicarboxylate/amino acid:cation symporter [Synergistaceae bacterium]MBR0075821.1 dicarboxylate/amino acid:cation symporter [Synergistaceae bacterium]MBR0233684.1 dicarboxylate/amino acid:cation symporter [Synergistaceae bacterium]MBR0253316.1 dicarboxylate/amino acid:cation symporter [Synergistaceae bacterium]